jgi:hypothetical protein
MMYFAVSFLAGVACKLYDDYVDNPLLTPHANPVFMEYLKGMHYILVTVNAVQEPMFVAIMYVANLIHCYFSPNSYSLPYEKSTLYTGLFFLLLLKSLRVEYTKFDGLFMSVLLFGLAVEPFVMTKDVSLLKMCVRFGIFCGSLFFTMLSQSRTLQFLYMYGAGYLAVSVAVQAYSLYTVKFNELHALYGQLFKSNTFWCTKWDDFFDTANALLSF